jgi:hypothetical protein
MVFFFSEEYALALILPVFFRFNLLNHEVHWALLDLQNLTHE